MTPLLLTATLLAAPAPAADLVALAEVERSFARACVRTGVRASFLEFFAPDGIVLAPAPTNARALYSARPAPATRPPSTLDWAPVSGAVAAAGDLGWTTGPYRHSDDTGREPARFGYYFSIWRKQADGSWKVALDVGTDMPAAESLDAALRDAHAAPAVPGPVPSQAELRALDAGFGAACAQADCLAEGARLHRPGQPPLLGRELVGAALRSAPARVFTTLGAEASSSGDLAYTYGTYALAPSPTHALEEGGSYVHLWRREAQGLRLAVVVTKPEARPAP